MTPTMSPRIPPAEGTESPWWVILDPRAVRLPHPEDVGGLHRCDECDAREGEPCTVTADEVDDDESRVGEERESPHESRGDYRDGVLAEHLYGAITGPFLSRASAEAALRRRRHAYSARAQVWCLSGHASPEWVELCREDHRAWAAEDEARRAVAQGITERPYTTRGRTS